MTSQSFEQALRVQADLALEQHGPLIEGVDDEENCLRNIEHEVDALLLDRNQAYRGFWDPFFGIIDNALVVLEMRTLDRPAHILNELYELVIRKQHDYGHGNILKFGIPGLQVRMSDKVERIKNLRKRAAAGAGNAVVGEALEDSYKDLIGYSLIGLMLQAGTFELELEGDRP